ncbi:hypothetical protein E2562_019519 [Oryza meyeriana var. granulata]|uniref:Transposase Tc1-like domain-containing protein n=1 Tax=Oryza meyeriana var. granulata TaxID=110450 RepID=A0A6G1CGZ3_9ORYZ|nr:hypothetical protein E2562_019519 [Oryza meyeriana var. granulata]
MKLKPTTKQTSWMKLKPSVKQSMQRSDPGMMKEGVTKSVANDIGVPWRVVQRVWRDGQIGGGVEAFKSKKKNCGRKKLPFNPDAIKDVPLRQRRTLELKAMTSVTRDIIRNYLIEKVLPAIKDKWPNEE